MAARALLAAPLLAATVVGCSSAQAQGTSTAGYIAPGSRPVAPAVAGNTLTGQRLRLSDERGYVVVLNFWASWCPPCRQEAPALAALAKAFAGRKVKFVGVDVNDSVAAAVAFEQSVGISYPSLNDPGEQIALAFHATVPPADIPSTLVIDQSGRIAGRILGAASYGQLSTLISQVLGGQA